MKAAIKQIKRFIDAASKAGCSEDEAAVDATLRKIGSYEQGEAMAKDTKTADELLKMLHERIQGFQLGLEPNPQWVKIVPVSDNIRALEGFSWPQNGTAGRLLESYLTRDA